MLKAKNSKKFKKDIKKYEHRQAVMRELINVIESLLNRQPLDYKYCDHPLGGNWNGHRECHVKPDILLIYKIVNNTLCLERLGSHSDLFK